MARTIEEIKKDITASFMRMEAVKSAYGLDGLKSFDECFSMASLENIIFYVFAVAVWSLEKLFDFHSADIDARIDRLEPHTLRWYVNKTKAFMYSQDGKVKLTLSKDADYYDPACLADLSSEKIEELKPIKYAVATESDTVVYIKVATEDGKTGGPTTLPPGMLTALRSYLEEVKDAGVSVAVRSEEADLIKISLLIYYNPTLLTVNGNDEGVAADGSQPVREAVRQVIQNLPFNGMFRKSDLMYALQALPCVEVADIQSVTAKPKSATQWHTVEGFDRPYSGYYSIDELTVVYRPYNTVDTDE